MALRRFGRWRDYAVHETAAGRIEVCRPNSEGEWTWMLLTKDQRNRIRWEN